MKNRVCEMFGIDFPLFAFSHCRDVVSAVSRSGGFGVLGAAALSPRKLEIELDWIDANIGGRPYGVDLLMPQSYVGRSEKTPPSALDLDAKVPAGHRAFIEGILKRYQVPELPEDQRRPKSYRGIMKEGARALLETALRHPVKLFVSALGSPPLDVVEEVHRRGALVGALAGKVKHAHSHVEAGVDLVIAQGTEAGGHTGEISTMVLVPEVVDAVSPVPVLAAGGIGCGRQVAAAMALGAEGVWTGSVWLTVTEADTIPPVVEKLVAAGSDQTVRSRCISGKPARILRTAWSDAWDAPESPGTLPMPLQHHVTSDAQERIQRYAHTPGGRELVGAPVGQIVGRMSSVRDVREVVRDMMEELVEAVDRVGRQLESE